MFRQAVTFKKREKIQILGLHVGKKKKKKIYFESQKCQRLTVTSLSLSFFFIFKIVQIYLVDVRVPHFGEKAESWWRVRVVDGKLDPSLGVRKDTY